MLIGRRTLLRALLGSAVLAATPLPAMLPTPAAAGPADEGGGSLAVKAWKWTALPGTGLEVHSTAPVAVTWVADGTITAPLRLTPPAVAGIQHVASGPGYGLAVRRIRT